MLIDTHAHITCDRLIEDIDAIIERARAHNVHKIVVVCTNIEEFERAEYYQKQYEEIDIILGFHPGDVDEVTIQDIEKLEEIIKQNRVIAIGEIGLDYHYEGYDSTKQKELFIKQIELANTYEYPIVIHMRDATKDTLDMIKQYAKTKFLMHCYSGSVETAEIIMKMGGYISFAGPLTFKNAKQLVEVPHVVSLDRMFVETDCPYLTPHPNRGKVNEPMYVNYTFDKLVDILGVSKLSLMKQIEANYHDFFKITE